MNQLENQLPLEDLFAKFLQKECTPSEIDFLMEHFRVEGNDPALKELILEEFKKERVFGQEKAVDAVSHRVEAKLNKQILAENTNRSSRTLQSSFGWLKYAAIWLIVAGASIGLYHTKERISDFFNPPKIQVVATQMGQRKTISLIDGSKIWLSPSSTVQFPDHFRGELREVSLNGEAYFEVAKDKKHPFVIHSGQTDTRVVGTSFTIQSFKSQENLIVTVVTGIVKVSSKSTSGLKLKEVTLKPDQRALFNQTTCSLNSENYPLAKQMLNRRDGILNYNGIPVQEIVNDLSRYYNIPILIESNKAKKYLFKGDFNTNEPVKITLQQLVLGINAKLSIKDNKYIINGGGEE